MSPRCDFDSRPFGGILDFTLHAKVYHITCLGSGFLHVVHFPPPINLTGMIQLQY